ncbi:Relaxase [Paraburkholderia tropica]|uniref:LPD7 domain-containing protein n=1 Tax=Paraburkholderia tropica TaxID=92647 RepID=UPI001CB3020A|nr:LPD7 domain-containing protein [Paraburkholderia tropica]CAG9235860.1 Relaxase [Paraburkholderia tropica]
MLIRIKGHVGGVKEYLETGKKAGRELGRDELDERVILAGDLDLANHIIEAMETDGERYLTITMSFREDDVDERVLREITAEFERFMFSAFQPGEYCYYAEAHLPRVKAYEHRKSGERIVRKPHIHIVVPKENLMSGQKLDPFAMVKYQTRYIDAFQEHINQKYGLASPKDHRRSVFTDASEMIARYKGDMFGGGNRELKANILSAVLERDISKYDDFCAMLEEFGERRTRNAGRDNEYENVKPADAARGVNLSDHLFSRDFIELDADAKAAFLTSRFEDGYVAAGAARDTPEALVSTLAEWHDSRAREVKYFNGGNLKAYPFYQQADARERQSLLAEREARFYQRYNEDHIHERIDREQPRFDDGFDVYGHDRVAESSAPEPSPVGAGEREYGDWRDRAEIYREFDPVEFAAERAAESANGLRSVPGVHVDAIDQGRFDELLSDHEPLHLADFGADQYEGMRWPRDRDGEGRAIEIKGPSLTEAAEIARWAYGEFDRAGAAARAELIAASGRKFEIEQFGLKGGGAFVDPFASTAQVGTLSTIGKLSDIGTLLDVDGYSGAAWAGPARETSRGGQTANLDHQISMWAFGDGLGNTARHPSHIRAAHGARAAGGRTGAYRDRGRFNARARETTGRETDSALGQYARDHVERHHRTRSTVLSEFQVIRRSLDASRLLAGLARSHGLIASKYEVTKGRDGSDRIQCGVRNLNVSDFLTKEMHLPWPEAARILRDTFARQEGREPVHAPVREPEQSLWSEFQGHRDAEIARERAAWDGQRVSEKTRRQDAVAQYKATRARIEANDGMSREERRAAMSLARMDKVERDKTLRGEIELERATLRRSSRLPFGEHYRDFLHERAQGGDRRALRELRRLRPLEPAADESLRLRPLRAHEDNAVIFTGAMTHRVDRDGVVTYQLRGVDIISDEGNSLRVWDTGDDAIENALRLAVQKFGTDIKLDGPGHFQVEAARVAAERRIFVRFEEARLNELMDERRSELDADEAERRRIEREHDAAVRQFARSLRDGQARTPQGDVDPDASGERGVPGNTAADLDDGVDR